MSTTILYVDDEESDSHPKTYTRGEIVPFEEDIVHEFKGHRTISVENRMPDLTKSGEFIKTRQQWSKYLCGMLNSGFGGILYGGIQDNGEAYGFMMSEDQKDHVILQLDDVFGRFDPPVARHFYQVKFVPVVEPFDRELVLDPVGREDHGLKHIMNIYRRCWCDNDAAASHSFEVKIVKQSVVEYRAEDGKKYIRRHGMTEEMEERNVKCLRCGGFGHLARNCPSPPSCYHCSEIGHRASNCPKNDFFFNNIKKDTKGKRSQSPKFCHFCEQEGHGIRECPEIVK